MSLCFFVSYLLRVHVHAHQLGHAATPHPIGTGDVYQLGRVEVWQLLQVVDGSGLQVEAPTSAELVRHEACNPDYPDAGAYETPPRRLSPDILPASRTGRSQGPRSGLRAKAQLFATALTRPRTGRSWPKRWAFDFIPEHF
jgi:hypothetical protein